MANPNSAEDRARELHQRHFTPSAAPPAGVNPMAAYFQSLDTARMIVDALGEEVSQEPDEGIEPLTEEEWKVLNELGKPPIQTHFQVPLATACELSRRKLGPLLKGLNGRGLINYPRGPRKGCALTPAGKQLLARKIP